MLCCVCCVVLRLQDEEFPGPVWLGLLKRCNDDVGGKCQSCIIDQFLAQHQQLDAAVREAQAQAAAARAEAAELGAELQALQGQVPQLAQAGR